MRLRDNTASRKEERLKSGMTSSSPEERYFGIALREFTNDELKGIAALDIGCGRGLRDLMVLKKRGATTLIGIDVFERSSITVQDDEVQYMRTDIDEADIPLSNGTLDMVVLDSVLEHLYHPMHVMSECLRVLKPNGNLVILTPNQARLKNRLKLSIGGSIYYPLEYWANPSRMWIDKRGMKVFAGHIREYTPSEVRKMIVSAGFRIRCSKLTKAQHVSGLDPILGASSADSIESKLRSRGALFIYNCAEAAFPSWRTTIITIATRPETAPPPPSPGIP